jgi:hypothetical protein
MPKSRGGRDIAVALAALGCLVAGELLFTPALSTKV